MSPSVTVIVPVRESGGYIKELLTSLAAQVYDGSLEIILCGNKDDATWQDVPTQFPFPLHKVEISNPKDWAWRDSNRKRNAGAEKATGEILAFTDSRITHPTDWLAKGVSLIQETQAGAVAGVMRAKQEDTLSLLAIYADTAFIKRNPTFGRGYYLTTANFGNYESLPITSTFFIRNELFRTVHGAPEHFAISYEDYSLAWRIVQSGSNIWCTDELYVFHSHRSTLSSVILEYRRSGRAAAQLFTEYPDCPYAVRRATQVTVLTLIALLSLVYICSAVMLGFGTLLSYSLWTVVLLLGITILASIIESRDTRGVIFPFLMILFVGAFVFAFQEGRMKGGYLSRSDKKYFQS